MNVEIEYTKFAATNNKKKKNINDSIQSPNSSKGISNNSIHSILRAPTRSTHTEATTTSPLDSPRSSHSLSSSSYYLDSCATNCGDDTQFISPHNSDDTDTDDIESNIDLNEFYNEKDIFENFGGDQLSLSSLLTSSSCQSNLSSSSSSSLSSNLIASFRNNRHTSAINNTKNDSLDKKLSSLQHPHKNVRFCILPNTNTTSENTNKENTSKTNKKVEITTKMKKTKSSKQQAVGVPQQTQSLSACIQKTEMKTFSNTNINNNNQTNQVKCKSNKKVDFIDFNLSALKSNYNFLVNNNNANTNNTLNKNRKKQMPIEISQQSSLPSSSQSSPKSSECDKQNEDSSFADSNLSCTSSSSSSEVTNSTESKSSNLNNNITNKSATAVSSLSSTSSGVSSNISSASSTTSETPSSNEIINSPASRKDNNVTKQLGHPLSPSTRIQQPSTIVKSKLAPKAVISDDGDIEIETPAKTNANQQIPLNFNYSQNRYSMRLPSNSNNNNTNVNYTNLNAILNNNSNMHRFSTERRSHRVIPTNSNNYYVFNGQAQQQQHQQTLINKESNERFNNNNTNGYQNFLQQRQNYHQNQLNAANAASVAVSFFL